MTSSNIRHLVDSLTLVYLFPRPLSDKIREYELGGRVLRTSHLRQIIWSLILVLAWPVAGWAQEFVPGEVIVKLKGKAGSSNAAGFFSKMRSQKGARLKTSFTKLNLHHMALKAGDDVQAAIRDLKNDPDVEFAEPNYILRKVPEDGGQIQSLSMEEAVKNLAVSSTSTYQQSGAQVQVTEAWSAMSNVSERPIVAVIDTGVDVSHPVFTGSDAVWSNSGEIPGNGLDDDNNGYVDDSQGWNFFSNSSVMLDDDGHGTHVAGIILGTTQDIFKSALDLSKVRIMPLKFLGADGSGSTSNAIKAIYYAVNNGAQVINNSWGGSAGSSSLLEALTYAYQQGVSIVAAAGNSALNNDVSPMYPASYTVPSLISVAASNDWDSLASFSNYGVGSVHVSAPGVSILSTIPAAKMGYSSGTSMAAPFVAGLAALALREAPNLTGFQVKSVIIDSGLSVAGLSSKIISGKRVNALNVVVEAKNISGSQSFQPEFVASSAASDRSPASEGSLGAKGGGCGLVSAMGKAASGAGGGGTPPSALLVIGLLLAPLAVWTVLRSKQNQSVDGKSRRKYERFMMNSEIKVNVGGRELVGAMSTISVGGLSFNADTMLENGGLITMTVASPDGKESIQVEGRVVWNEQNHSYGVAFSEAKETTIEKISNWTSGLVKAS